MVAALFEDACMLLSIVIEKVASDSGADAKVLNDMLLAE